MEEFIILNSDEETIDKEELEDIVNDLKEMSVEEFCEELVILKLK